MLGVVVFEFNPSTQDSLLLLEGYIVTPRPAEAT